ncbi:MAG: MBOAT family O-acyltransferase [Chloroflexota bacterium]
MQIEQNQFVAQPIPLRRWGFIAACLVGSAILVVLVGDSTLSLLLYGASLLIVMGVALVVRHLHTFPDHRRWLAPLTIALLVGVLIFSRFGRLQILLFGTTIGRFGEWVGLSYLIFRLIHIVIDSKKLGDSVLRSGDLAAYALFPPALVAGPIHRANQFLPQLDQPYYPTSQPKLLDSLWRIGLGLIKKLVLANALALYVLTPDIAANPALPSGLLWLSLLAYTFMIYFDFAGYSDIAIGAAGLVGITLPENFANPYAQPSITRFWQAWHISLSTWLRDYLFFPISRTLLTKLGRNYNTLIMAVAHLTTMALAGLWHGFTTGFLAWGLWHGVGLFIHAQFSGIAKRRNIVVSPVIGVSATFLFVMIGWVFFAMPSFTSALHFLSRLFGR